METGDIDDICIWVNAENMTDNGSAGLDFRQSVLVTSSIFYNFGSVLRAGVNCTIALQKCLLKDCTSNTVHAVNPKALIIDRCSIQGSKKAAILIEWLKESDSTHFSRNIILVGNEIRSSQREGVCIQSHTQFSAHNLKILI